jgi:TonB family protein
MIKLKFTSMNRIFITVLILMVCSLLKGQDIVEKKYYKNKYKEPAKSEKLAKLVEITIQEPDGTLRYELRDTKSDKLLQLKLYKDKVPVGKWLFTDNFELEYISQEYEGFLRYDIKENSMKGDTSSELEPPVFPLNDNDFRSFIAANLNYPCIAAENGIQGKVISQFILDESGKITRFSILESADPELDKEAARVILKSPTWTPAKLDGHPVGVHIIMPIVFVLK